MALAMRWIIQYSKSRKGLTMSDRLAAELIAASNNEGSSIKKNENHGKLSIHGTLLVRSKVQIKMQK